MSEMVVFAVAGDFWAWALQFVAPCGSAPSWWSRATSSRTRPRRVVVDAEDWGVDQVEQANDLKVIGNRYVDCFLSAGLSSHRVHHVLPFQRSGFANIATEDVLREESAKFGVEWLPAKSFVTDRLPKLCRTYLLSPSRQAKEHNWGFVREHLLARGVEGQRRLRGLGASPESGRYEHRSRGWRPGVPAA